MKKILKDNRGSITTVVTVTVLFFSVILSTAYMITSTNRKTQLKSEAIVKETYESPLNNLDEISDSIKEKTLADAYNAGDIKIGDYMDYRPVAGKTYTSVTNENGWADQTYTVDTSTTWRVLGKENGQVLLISGSPIKKDMNTNSLYEWDKDPYLYMKGAYSYLNWKTMLTNICDLYSNEFGTARSITMEDINRTCGVKVEGNNVYLESDPNKTNIDRRKIRGETYTYKSTDYTPESYVNGKTNTEAGNKINITIYYYDIISMKNNKIGNTTLGSLLFDRTTESEKYSKAYWLASDDVSKDYNEDRAYFGAGVVTNDAYSGNCYFYSDGDWAVGRLGVRVVIKLNSDVTLKDVPLLEDQNVTEETWAGYEASSIYAEGDASNGEAGNHGLETEPYLPSTDFTKVDGTDLDTGLVIEDGDKNQYVWVEVPKNKTVYPTAGLNITKFTDEEYTKIENDLHTYTSAYRNGTSYTDTWSADTDNEGWLTEIEYNALKKKMLKSVYKNGGFYVGRYEAGIDPEKENARYYDVNENMMMTKHSITQKAVIKANSYPYNWVQRTQAFELAKNMEHGMYTSSILFGVQWDLMMAFFHNKGNVDNSIINKNSTGNYMSTEIIIANIKARYSLDYGKTYNLSSYPKEKNTSILLTTGADNSFGIMNIFDVGGNVFEWTLENGKDENYPYVTRGGGGLWYENTQAPMSSRWRVKYQHNYVDTGFRVTIF